MSIINDALQKIQRARKKRHGSLQYISENQNRSVWKSGIFFLAMVVLLIGLLTSYTQLNLFQSNAIVKNKLTLNGVFISDEMKMAMINNQEYHIGDKIGKLKVMSIEEDSVKLAHKNKVTELNVEA